MLVDYQVRVLEKTSLSVYFTGNVYPYSAFTASYFSCSDSKSDSKRCVCERGGGRDKIGLWKDDINLRPSSHHVVERTLDNDSREPHNSS